SLKRACREYDYVARMGGDEFVVLLPGVSGSDTGEKMYQFREVVKQVGRELFSTNLLTVSIGAAHFPFDGSDAEELLAEADRRMYKEKHAHRSQKASPDVSLGSKWTATV